MSELDRAAGAIRDARALLVTAGAGMGVDSGLPDFRGDEGFWRAYPPYRRLGLSFVEMASPRHFVRDAALGWGFYGHRLGLYRATRPHAGFGVLARWAATRDAFVFTSNVDGQFQRAGFDEARLVECHGSIHHLQCAQDCGTGIFPADGVVVSVDENTMRARPPLPACLGCGGLARPNVLMFGDAGWDPTRTEQQEARFDDFLTRSTPASLVVVECGAGTAVPTVRRLGDELARRGATLVRINVREPEGPPGSIGIALPALGALFELDQRCGA